MRISTGGIKEMNRGTHFNLGCGLTNSAADMAGTTFDGYVLSPVPAVMLGLGPTPTPLPYARWWCTLYALLDPRWLLLSTADNIFHSCLHSKDGRLMQGHSDDQVMDEESFRPSYGRGRALSSASVSVRSCNGKEREMD